MVAARCLRLAILPAWRTDELGLILPSFFSPIPRNLTLQVLSCPFTLLAVVDVRRYGHDVQEDDPKHVCDELRLSHRRCATSACFFVI
jgi:hypothetical protein